MLDTILAGIVTFLIGSVLGGKFLVYLYKRLGKLVDRTETEIDDNIYKKFPEIADFMIQNFEFGVIEDILENMLKQLNKIPGDTREVEEKLKDKKDSIKK